MMRQASSIIAVLVLAAAWLGPLPELAAGSFAAHMTLHMIVVAIAAPLMSIGLAGSSLDPVEKVPGLFAALPASLIELVVVWTWHAPALHHAARHRSEIFVVEQALFLAAGLFFWVSVLGGKADTRMKRAGGGIVALLLTFAHMTLLGALLSLTPRVLYHGSLEDQQLGGTIMLVLSGISYIGGGLWLSHGMVGRMRPQVGPA